MNPYKELANAIIVQAVKDYRDAVERLRYTPDDKSALHDKLLEKLKEEVSV